MTSRDLPMTPRCSPDDLPTRAAPCVVYQLRECAAKPAFLSVCWREASLEVVELRTVHRQRDAAFMRALNEVREGPRKQETTLPAPS